MAVPGNKVQRLVSSAYSVPQHPVNIGDHAEGNVGADKFVFCGKCLLAESSLHGSDQVAVIRSQLLHQLPMHVLKAGLAYFFDPNPEPDCLVPVCTGIITAVDPLPEIVKRLEALIYLQVKHFGGLEHTVFIGQEQRQLCKYRICLFQHLLNDVLRQIHIADQYDCVAVFQQTLHLIDLFRQRNHIFQLCLQLPLLQQCRLFRGKAVGGGNALNDLIKRDLHPLRLPQGDGLVIKFPHDRLGGAPDLGIVHDQRHGEATLFLDTLSYIIEDADGIEHLSGDQCIENIEAVKGGELPLFRDKGNGLLNDPLHAVLVGIFPVQLCDPLDAL